MAVGEHGAVLLDWDDCLVVTRPPKYQQHKFVAQTFYGYALTDAIMDQHWGTGLRNELPYFYGNPDATEAEIDEMVARFTETADQFPKPLQADTEVFINTIDGAGILRGIVTSHLTKNAILEVRASRLNPDEFLCIQGSDITPARKPDPRVFDPALELLAERGIKSESVNYVGDDLRDGLAAHAAGLGFAGVTSGVTSLEEFQDHGFYAVTRLGIVARTIIEGTVDLHAAG